MSKIKRILRILACMCVLAPAFVALPASAATNSITPQAVLKVTNTARRSAKVQSLKLNSKLAIAAQARAEDMARNSYFSHVSPTGTNMLSVASMVGYNYSRLGENLAEGYSSVQGMQKSWMASLSHRKNIVSKEYKEMGVGIAQGLFNGQPVTFVVELFGAPQKALAYNR